MAPRDTSTGKVHESMTLPALIRGGYSYERQVAIGEKLGGGMYRVDILVTAPNGEQIPVSLKWQEVRGTAEEKVPFDVMCLADLIHKSQGKFTRAYVVLGGVKWKRRGYYLSGDIAQYLKNCDMVKMISLEEFVAKANSKQL